MGDNADLLNKIAIYNSEAENHSKLLFPEHYSHEVIQDGIHSGKFKKATFQVDPICFCYILFHIFWY